MHSLYLFNRDILCTCVSYDKHHITCCSKNNRSFKDGTQIGLCAVMSFVISAFTHIVDML